MKEKKNGEDPSPLHKLLIAVYYFHQNETYIRLKCLQQRCLHGRWLPAFRSLTPWVIYQLPYACLSQAAASFLPCYGKNIIQDVFLT